LVGSERRRKGEVEVEGDEVVGGGNIQAQWVARGRCRVAQAFLEMVIRSMYMLSQHRSPIEQGRFYEQTGVEVAENNTTGLF